MSIEHSDEHVEEVVGDAGDVVDSVDAVDDAVIDGDEVVEIDAESLAAAAQSAGITDADVTVEANVGADADVDMEAEVDAEVNAESKVEVDAEPQEDIEETAEPTDSQEPAAEESPEETTESDDDEKIAEISETEGDAAVVTVTEEVAEVPEVAGTNEDADDEEVFQLTGEPEPVEEIEIVTSICTDDGVEVTVESVVEAILFASDEPITPNRLVNIVETGSVKQIRDCVKNLNEMYEENNLAFRIERIAGGYQMMTLDAYNHWLRKMIRVRADNKLTQAALETLAIVAYKQPIMRADVEGIRGVSSGEMIRSLMYKGLVRITGRAEVLGRPMLYGTTKKFLDVFGLNSAKDLPKIDELKKPQE